MRSPITFGLRKDVKMGKAADFTRKSTKTSVLLYRIFLKISMAAAVYIAYLLLTSSHFDRELLSLYRSTLLTKISAPVTFALTAAIAYALTYFLYKSNSNDFKSLLKRSPMLGQIMMIFKVVIFLFGLTVIIIGCFNVLMDSILGWFLIPIGFIIAQMLHTQSFQVIFLTDGEKKAGIAAKHDDKKRISEVMFSHLSTFTENVSAGVLVVAMNLSYKQPFFFVWVIFLVSAIVLLALQEIFYHYYNTVKNNKNGKSTYKKDEIKDRKLDFVRDSFVYLAVIFVWMLLVVTDTVSIIVESDIYGNVMKVVPLLISIITVSVLIYNNFIKKPSSGSIRYNPTPSKKNFEDELESLYGQGSVALKALDYVTKNMNRLTGYIRYNGDDYYVHPIAVAKILIEHATENIDSVTIAAALLHDCIEDMPGCTREFVSEEFGDDVASIVALVSKSPDKNYHISQNMIEYLDAISHDPRASLIKTADRMNNNSTMEYSRESAKIYKAEETRRFYMPFIAKAVSKDDRNKKFYKKAEDFFKDPIPGK